MQNNDEILEVTDASSNVTNESIINELRDLNSKFDQKIERDQYKNELFDKMHKQLEEYQNDVIASSINPLLMEIIILIDQIRKNNTYISNDFTQEGYEKLLRLYDGVAEDLEAILLRQDVEPYSDNVNKIDIKRQKVSKSIPTDIEEMDNVIEESVASGYTKAGKIIRQEKVNIYKHKK